ncbi:putative LINOLEOYL-CoA DESATURASE (DELTA(6)-DESATURASE) [Euzebya pacifica]|uniref:Putative LINOLEOYL-CoA DESATURASE (DELTA(6)-DESATURASE) n=1 Tax=Euzebya pacifica TaxID=1608957 RepID=A0A346XV52_9ACTN|nr:acyl-CoA desaturase [Euzebya pacifica]AXV06099.1 putative LINOLEOYL-CoA DESATURASE (DELTA(6)-DESATURASE) [Euzebya pacifica]
MFNLSTLLPLRTAGPVETTSTTASDTDARHWGVDADGRPLLTDEQVEALGRDLDVIREREFADLGEIDSTYIRRIVAVQRSLEIGGRGLLFLGFLPPAWFAGVVALSLSKILDNMEIGHNVMHGQYDWMNDPNLHSSKFEWDTAAPAENWKHGHNFLHHTYTNIIGKDRDIGYGILRMTEHEKWTPSALLNPLKGFLLAVLFQWGVALHDIEVEKILSGDKSIDEAQDVIVAIRHKARRQAFKDYVLFPLLGLPIAPLVFAGNAAANLIRNVWAFTIIFCGHFPEGVALFTEEEVADETRGGWYLRQMLGSANLTGGKLFHIMSGNLSHQIEHHLFPDMPARRYQRIAGEVQEICERYGLPYNSGPLRTQFGSVVAKICRLALPNGTVRKGRPDPRVSATGRPAVTRPEATPAATTREPVGAR